MRDAFFTGITVTVYETPEFNSSITLLRRIGKH